jgi:hypothetical protein
VAAFGRNRDISLHVCEDGILIVAYSTADKTADDILYGNDLLFTDAVRKALLIYAIRYGKYIGITSAEVRNIPPRMDLADTTGAITSSS